MRHPGQPLNIAASIRAEPRHVFLAGASRGVGRAIAVLLCKNGVSVTALLRSTAAQRELEALEINVVLGDALRFADVSQAMESAVPVDAVISTIGGASPDGSRPDYLGNRNLIDAYRTVGGGRGKFVLVSSIGSGSSSAAVPPEIRKRLAAALDEKEQAEAHLISSGVPYVVIRPGGLRSEPATGRGVLTRDPGVSGSIHRADVAQLVYACVLSGRADNEILSAVDRDFVRDARPFEEFPLDVQLEQAPSPSSLLRS